MQVLGDDARSVMTQHYETWVVEDDIEQLYKAGMNHIRIPVGTSFVPFAMGHVMLQFVAFSKGLIHTSET